VACKATHKRITCPLIITQYYVGGTPKNRVGEQSDVGGVGQGEAWQRKVIFFFKLFAVQLAERKREMYFSFLKRRRLSLNRNGLFLRNDKKKYKNPMSSEKEIVSEKKLQIDVTENKVTIDINGVGVIYDKENFISIIESTDSFKHALELRENLL